ncbi:MAG: hypothetical protein KQA41_02945 [Candidatus Aenigmarchaeota archaeon]|nr:hypothetical protein [Candidatus Aenigmarchaeota archaeon]MBU5689158.1 hypothetical protein [Candidatus Aenigmarchaeota archaeon]
MDLIFHVILGLFLSKIFIGHYSLLVVIFSILPDIIGALPYEINKFYLTLKYKGNKIKKYISYTKRTKVFHNYQKIIYKSTHNLFALLLFLFVAKIFFPDIYIVLFLAYFLHLFFDSYTHEGDFAMQPFYPFKLTVKGRSWALNKKIVLLNWSLLIIGIVYFSLK